MGLTYDTAEPDAAGDTLQRTDLVHHVGNKILSAATSMKRLPNPARSR